MEPFTGYGLCPHPYHTKRRTRYKRKHVERKIFPLWKRSPETFLLPDRHIPTDVARAEHVHFRHDPKFFIQRDYRQSRHKMAEILHAFQLFLVRIKSVDHGIQREIQRNDRRYCKRLYSL